MSVKIKKGSLKVNDNGEFKDIGVFVGDTRENIEAINEAGNAKISEINEASIAASDIIATDRSQVTDNTKILINAATDNVVVVPTIEEHNKLADDISAINDDFKANSDRITALEQGGVSGGIPSDFISALQEILLGGIFDNNKISNPSEKISALSAYAGGGSDTPVTPPEDEPTVNPVSVAWVGTTATISNLKNLTVSYSGTVATIGV